MGRAVTAGDEGEATVARPAWQVVGGVRLGNPLWPASVGQRYPDFRVVRVPLKVCRAHHVGDSGPIRTDLGIGHCLDAHQRIDCPGLLGVRRRQSGKQAGGN